MDSLMQQALGADWARLHPTLQRHYRAGDLTEQGMLEVHYPRFMQPLLWLLRRLGALVDRPGLHVQTRVVRQARGARLDWQRTLRYPGGPTLRFDSQWRAGQPGQLVEFVNPWLGLVMAPAVDGDRLRYRGVCFVLQLGRWRLRLPEWLALGHTTIVEEALDEAHYAMDFRMTHPLLGELFRYRGRFAVDPRTVSG